MLWISAHASICCQLLHPLVIGQSAYRSVTPLPNPANDAKAMAQLLTDSGFDVTSTADLSQTDMNREVGDFAANQYRTQCHSWPDLSVRAGAAADQEGRCAEEQ